VGGSPVKALLLTVVIDLKAGDIPPTEFDPVSQSKNLFATLASHKLCQARALVSSNSNGTTEADELIVRSPDAIRPLYLVVYG
jgi:hypothetical protein